MCGLSHLPKPPERALRKYSGLFCHSQDYETFFILSNNPSTLPRATIPLQPASYCPKFQEGLRTIRMTSRKLLQRDRSCSVHFFWGKGNSTPEAVQQHAVPGWELSPRPHPCPSHSSCPGGRGLTQFPGSFLSSMPDLHHAFVRQVLITSPACPGSSRQMCVTGLLLCTRYAWPSSPTA